MTQYERRAKTCIVAARARLGPAANLVSSELVWAPICKEIIDMLYTERIRPRSDVIRFLETFEGVLVAAAKLHEKPHLPFEPSPKGQPA